jgi:hypothetical protein
MSTRRNPARVPESSAPAGARYISLVGHSVKVGERTILLAVDTGAEIATDDTSAEAIRARGDAIVAGTAVVRRHLELAPAADPGQSCERIPESSLPHELAHDPQKIVDVDVWNALTAEERERLLWITQLNVPYREVTWANLMPQQKAALVHAARVDLTVVAADDPAWGFLVRSGLRRAKE